MKAYSFQLEMKDRIIKTHVYSETGEDIAERFPQYKVSDIKQLDKDPVKAAQMLLDRTWSKNVKWFVQNN